jgi:GT2 family glycosyltransferase
MSASSGDTESGRLYILLPVHNRRQTTVCFVEALKLQTWRGFQLILIDDGSTDGTADAVRAIHPEVEIISGDGTWWWAGSLDQGCRYLERSGIVSDDILLLINDDVIIAPEFLEHALAEFRQTKDSLFLARQFDSASGREIDRGGGICVNLHALRFAAASSSTEINCLPTRGLFMRWRDMSRAGGFRPKWLPHYLSDYEFTVRAWKRGLQLRVAQTASLGVQVRQSGRSRDSLFMDSRGRRFALLFSNRYKDNPVTWSVFAWLAAPAWCRPYLWAKIWCSFLVTAARCLFTPVKRV